MSFKLCLRLVPVAIFVTLAFGQDRVRNLQRAAALIERQELAAAEAALRPVLEETPGDAIALNLLGLIRMRQRHPDEAEDLFRQAIAAGHGIAGPHINLALLYERGRPLEAIAELAEALRLAPGNAQAQSLLRGVAHESALAARRSGDAPAALALLRKARESLPGDAGVLYEFGLAALASGLFQDAQAALEEALRIQPGHHQARYALARVYLGENMAKRAEEQMRSYLAERPGDASAQYGLGYVLMAEEKLDEAKAAFERSLALQPEQTESVFELGELALEQGRDADACELFEKVLARDPRHAGALTGMGVAAYRAAAYVQARTRLERAIASAPSYQKARYYYALTLSKLGDKTGAMREFEVANSLQKSPGAAPGLAAARP